MFLKTLGIRVTIVGMTGVGRRLVDKGSATLSYLGEVLYILHLTVIVVTAFYVVKIVAPWPLQWLALLAVVVPATFGLYEVVTPRRSTPLPLRHEAEEGCAG